MANLKEIKIRIGSVKKTRQITAAMKLVAGAKLRKATEAAVSARPYQEKLSETLARVASRAGESVEHPLLTRRDEVKRILVVALTTDRGLCGGFNNTLLRRAIDYLERREGEGVEIDVVVYGRKGRDFLNGRGRTFTDVKVDWLKRDKMDIVRELATMMTQGFAEGTYDQVVLAYNEFVNAITQKPTFRQMLPLEVPEQEGEVSLVDYIYEPDPRELLGNLLPLYLRTQLLQTLLETEAGEHAARMTAMDNATRNANDLIERLTLEYNRARQAAITTEITEIVSGAEAL